MVMRKRNKQEAGSGRGFSKGSVKLEYGVERAERRRSGTVAVFSLRCTHTHTHTHCTAQPAQHQPWALLGSCLAGAKGQEGEDLSDDATRACVGVPSNPDYLSLTSITISIK